MDAEVSDLYDKLYDEGQAILDRINPCELKRDDNGVYTCVMGKPDCCTRCKYLGPDGCTVKALGCKLGACWVHKYPDTEKWQAAAVELKVLVRAAYEGGVHLFARQSKQDVTRLRELK